jgi:hypothetical protein
MSKTLYNSPDIPVIDYTNTGNDSNAQRPFAIDERSLAKKTEMKNDAKEILEGFTGYIRAHDFTKGEDMGKEDTSVKDFLTYLQDNIPDTSIYLSGLPKDATDEQKIEAIRCGLEGRSKVIDEYNNRVVCESPFLGKEVDESRSKQEAPELSKRYKSQYDMIPSVRSTVSTRGSVKSYKTQRNPKLTRLKFL